MNSITLCSFEAKQLSIILNFAISEMKLTIFYENIQPAMMNIIYT